MKLVCCALMLLCLCAKTVAADSETKTVSAQFSLMNYTDKVLTIMVDGKPHKAIMRTPSRLSPEPALLITLATNQNNNLDIERKQNRCLILKAEAKSMCVS